MTPFGVVVLFWCHTRKAARTIPPDVKFTLRLSAEQNELVERRAKELNLSKNQYIAKLIQDDGRDPGDNIKRMREILNEIIKEEMKK